MPLQNRVDPFGAIFRTTARGTFMGNRGGALHNDHRQIVRSHKGSRWITCLLEFKGRRRTVMTPNRYTELFFLDEAVSFAAGHRPCAECRRRRFDEFRQAWKSWSAPGSPEPIRVPEMDALLHRSRIDRHGAKVTYEANLDTLPDATFVQIGDSAWLVWHDHLLLWTPEGYTKRQPRPGRLTATVLTPRPIVECFRTGYRPEVHSSAL